MKNPQRALTALVLAPLALAARAGDISFDDLAAGTVISNQYAGVTFTANALSGTGFATNTDMRLADSTGNDVFELGTPGLVSGNVLHSFGGWLGEDGDPSFRVSFATPINLFSADFAGVDDAANVKLMAYDGSTLLGTIVGSSTAEQFHLSITSARITSVVVVPGSFSDYVAVDNLHYVSAVPEASTTSYGLLGAALLGCVGLRRRAMAG